MNRVQDLKQLDWRCEVLKGSAHRTWFSRTSKPHFRTFVTKRSIFFGPTTLKMLMKLLSTITTEDRWVIGSIALTLSGIILGALLSKKLLNDCLKTRTLSAFFAA